MRKNIVRERMFFKKKNTIDWISKPVHSSLNEALKSEDIPPYRIKAVVDRCGFAAGANYGGLLLSIAHDSHFISCYPTGGAEAAITLTEKGDSVFILVNHEYRLGQPVANKFEAIDFINMTLESQFGSQNYKRLANVPRDWCAEGA